MLPGSPSSLNSNSPRLTLERPLTCWPPDLWHAAPASPVLGLQVTKLSQGAEWGGSSNISAQQDPLHLGSHVTWLVAAEYVNKTPGTELLKYNFNPPVVLGSFFTPEDERSVAIRRTLQSLSFFSCLYEKFTMQEMNKWDQTSLKFRSLCIIGVAHLGGQVTHILLGYCCCEAWVQICLGVIYLCLFLSYSSVLCLKKAPPPKINPIISLFLAACACSRSVTLFQC